MHRQLRTKFILFTFFRSFHWLLDFEERWEGSLMAAICPIESWLRVTSIIAVDRWVRRPLWFIGGLRNTVLRGLRACCNAAGIWRRLGFFFSNFGMELRFRRCMDVWFYLSFYSAMEDYRWELAISIHIWCGCKIIGISVLGETETG